VDKIFLQEISAMDAFTKERSHGRTGVADRQTENPVKKFKFLLLFSALLFLPIACAQLLVDQTGSAARPADIAVQYHVWFRIDSSCPSSDPLNDWFHWLALGTSDNGCNFKGGTSWLRDVSTTAYPLIGPYEGGAAEVVRWHIRLAKAAGITAFFVSTAPGASSAENTEFMNKMLTALRVAWEENFKIGLEAWMPITEAGGTSSSFYSLLKSNIETLTSSPYASALYKIDNLPVVWFVRWDNWDIDSNLVSDLINQKQAYYIWNGDRAITDINSMKSAITNGSKIAQAGIYNFPTTSGCAFHNDLSTQLDNYGLNGYLRFSHAYPYFDESGGGFPPGSARYCLSNNGALLADFLSESAQGSASLIIVESWNDFIERTGIEPGMDINPWQDTGQEEVFKGDPYRTLKQIAAWKGVTWQTPFLDCAIVDPLLQEHGVVECATAPHPPPP
jgi:hypothetical protein